MSDLHDVISGQSALDNSPLDVSCGIPSSDVLLLPWNDAGPDGNPSSVPAVDEIHPASSSRSKRDSKTSPRRSTRRCKTCKMGTWSDATNAFSDDMPVIDFESDRE